MTQRMHRGSIRTKWKGELLGASGVKGTEVYAVFCNGTVEQEVKGRALADG